MHNRLCTIVWLWTRSTWICANKRTLCIASSTHILILIDVVLNSFIWQIFDFKLFAFDKIEFFERKKNINMEILIRFHRIIFYRCSHWSTQNCSGQEIRQSLFIKLSVIDYFEFNGKICICVNRRFACVSNSRSGGGVKRHELDSIFSVEFFANLEYTSTRTLSDFACCRALAIDSEICIDRSLTSMGMNSNESKQNKLWQRKSWTEKCRQNDCADDITNSKMSTASYDSTRQWSTALRYCTIEPLQHNCHLMSVHDFAWKSILWAVAMTHSTSSLCRERNIYL